MYVLGIEKFTKKSCAKAKEFFMISKALTGWFPVILQVIKFKEKLFIKFLFFIVTVGHFEPS